MDDLAGHFERVAERLNQERSALNQSDSLNGNHGDHMIAIFQVASQAARLIAGSDLASAMELAGQMLQQLENNASAQIYAQGLQQFALQFRQHEVSFDQLESYIQSALSEEKIAGPKESKSGDVLKAIVSGLAGWQSASQTEEAAKKGMNMGYLFDLGIAYLQARQSVADKLEALAETAISGSPLGKTPHRARSGKLVIITLLQALQQG
jgi:hypothetical protein